jgi:hypothetical protein
LEGFVPYIDMGDACEGFSQMAAQISRDRPCDHLRNQHRWFLHQHQHSRQLVDDPLRHPFPVAGSDHFDNFLFVIKGLAKAGRLS